MSTTLPDGTPEADAAADAPADDSAATTDSVSSADVIPKERFNGLQAKYQTDKSAWDAERAALLSQLETRHQAEETPEVSEANEELAAQVAALTKELARQSSANARRDAIAKFPGAAPLADLIVGDTPEEIEAVASMLQDRLAGLVPATGSDDSDDADDDSETDATGASGDAASGSSTPPTHGGGATFDGDAAVGDKIAAAVEARDFSGFLAAATERALQGNTDLTVG